ncbi:MAG: cytochrome P450 [Chloroflexota bacterium]|nr:cytochrome P450 [Chloroflexota bacterium]
MQFDPRAPEFRSNPYPYYELLQSHAPIFFWETWGIWFLSHYEDCHTLLRDNRLGREDQGEFEAPAQQKPLFEMMNKWMLFLDPPDHTRLRSLVHKAFTPRVVAQLRQDIQQVTDDLLDRVQDQGEMELIADLAYPLPVTVICVLLGIPPADHVYFHDWSDAIARSLDLTEESAVYDRAAEAAIALTDYLEGLLAERRADPQDDLLSALVAVEEEGDRLTKAELFATCALLLLAGHETTINLIGNGTLALLRHPDQWQKLRENPDLIQSAVEELLRYDSPVQLTERTALEDIQFKGHLFHKGQKVAFLLGAANRDPAQFADPAKLDITRRDNRHLAFGGGIHYCMGAPLARLEGTIAFQTLARRMPNLTLASDTVTYRDNYVLRGLESLRLTF